MQNYFMALTILFTWVSFAHAAGNQVKGYSLTETWHYSSAGAEPIHTYDAELDPSKPKTAAQEVVDHLFAMGVRRINLSPQANMRSPRASSITPNTPAGPKLRKERERYKRLIQYIVSKGMTVGIRPIFFVLTAEGSPNYTEVINGKTVKWWHGNIQPANPLQWFESFKAFLSMYYPLGNEPGVEEFTLGAELYSLTVGIEDQWLEYPHGFAGEWVKILAEAKKSLPASVRVMYDINFTDDRADTPQLSQFGGEFARWYYRLVGFSRPDPALVEFWNGLDAIGIDMYRSLATDEDIRQLPVEYEALVTFLQAKSDLYAQQIDQNLEKISLKLGTGFKDIVLKEIGFGSRERGFIRPFEYVGSGVAKLNLEHQAAAYDAIFRSFWKPGFEWMRGIVFWDASVDLAKHGAADLGFSPIGKAPTIRVISANWK